MRRARLAVAALVVVVPLALAVPSHAESTVAAPTADRPGLSGSISLYGHTLTWATGGVSAVPSNRADLAASYDGIVTPGTAVTFSGSMAFTIPAGAVTNLTQDAALGGGTPPGHTGYSGRVGGTTITTPFNLSARAPWTKDLPAQDNGVAATMTASVSSRNCNDYGVCGGPVVTLTFAVLKSGGGSKPPTANKPPVIKVLPSAHVTRLGARIPVAWTVTDDSGRAKWFTRLFSAGTPIAGGHSNGLERADGRVQRGLWPRTGGGSGPFYVCFYAEDAEGLTSANAPMSSCAWLTVQVSVPSVSNGCGAASWGPQVADVLNWAGDVRMYGTNPVNIRQACNQHDAGYAGVSVAGMTTSKVTDFRTWSREQVDQKFYDDIMKQCRRFLRGAANAAFLKQCQQDAYVYVGLVRQFGQAAFDADVTVPGVQAAVPASTTPAGGARANS